MIRALIALAILATPAVASAQDLSAAQVREQQAARQYCIGLREKLSFYANDLGWRIRANSAEFSSTGYITPYRANLTRQQIADRVEAVENQFRQMMYHNPDRATCRAMLNRVATDVHNIASPVLNLNE